MCPCFEILHIPVPITFPLVLRSVSYFLHWKLVQFSAAFGSQFCSSPSVPKKAFYRCFPSGIFTRVFCVPLYVGIFVKIPLMCASLLACIFICRQSPSVKSFTFYPSFIRLFSLSFTALPDRIFNLLPSVSPGCLLFRLRTKTKFHLSNSADFASPLLRFFILSCTCFQFYSSRYFILSPSFRLHFLNS